MRIEILDEAQEDLVEVPLLRKARDWAWILFLRLSLLRYLFAGIHQVVYGYHRCLSKRFPFAIYYDVERELIRVHAVLDCRRNPAWTRKRLK